MTAHITTNSTLFRFSVLYLDVSEKSAHIKTVVAHNAAEARIGVLGFQPVVLFEEYPTEYSEADHARN